MACSPDRDLDKGPQQELSKVFPLPLEQEGEAIAAPEPAMILPAPMARAVAVTVPGVPRVDLSSKCGKSHNKYPSPRSRMGLVGPTRPMQTMFAIVVAVQFVHMGVVIGV